MLKPNRHRSLVSFIRNKTKAKGTSEHTGRGAYWMTVDDGTSFEQIRDRLKGYVDKNLGLVSSYEYDAEQKKIEILFDEEYFDPHYRKLYVNGSVDPVIMSVVFTFPVDRKKAMKDMMEELNITQ